MELTKSIDGKYTISGIDGYFKTFNMGRAFEHVFYCIPDDSVGLKTREFIGSVSRGVYGEGNIKARRNDHFREQVEEIIVSYATKLMDKNPAAVTLGRLGGSVKSEKKAKASAENGKKGGWPKGKPRKEKV